MASSTEQNLPAEESFVSELTHSTRDAAARQARIDAVPLRRLWLAVLGPALAWPAQELASTAVSSTMCGTPRLARLVLIGIFVVTFGTSMGAGIVGWRSWKVIHGSERVVATHGSHEMIALASVLLGIVLTLGLLWSGLPVVVLDLCEVRR